MGLYGSLRLAYGPVSSAGFMIRNTKPNRRNTKPNTIGKLYGESKNLRILAGKHNILRYTNNGERERERAVLKDEVLLLVS